MTKEEITFGWHFLPADKKLTYGDGREVIAGRTLSVECTPECTEAGLHSLTTLNVALCHAPGNVICRVASWGDVDGEDDILAAKNRHVVWMLDGTQVLREQAAWCAQWALEQELSHGRDVDPRSRAAVDLAFAFAEGGCTAEQLEKARDAAWDAASAAARSAASAAAWCAAWCAALDAARSAARSAAWCVTSSVEWCAASNAATSIFDDWLEAAVLDEAKRLGVFIEDYDPRKAK